MAACRSPHNNDPLVHRRVFVLADPAQEEAPSNSTTRVPADTSYLEYLFALYPLTDIQQLDTSIRVRLSYSGTSNFLKTDLYDGLLHAYLPCEVAVHLCNAQHYLKQIRPDLSLLVLDAARPLHIQQRMWDSLKMDADKKFNYLSPPYETSLHNYGCAVDVTLLDISQNMLMDMGSEFDAFTPVSQPALEYKFLKDGSLSRTAYDNRWLLRYVMKRAGFSPIASEWWHFGYCSKEQAALKFQLIK